MSRFLWLLLGALLAILLCLLFGWNWWPVGLLIFGAILFMPFAFRRNGPPIHDREVYDYDEQ